MGGSTSSTAFNYDGQLAGDKKAQSVEVGDEVKGSTRPRRNVNFASSLVSRPYAEEKGGVSTIWEAFQRGVSKYGKSKMLGTRVYDGVDEKKKYLMGSDNLPRRGKYMWESYEQADAQVRALGAGLIELGARPKDNIGIWSVNRAEWVVASLAFYSQNMRTVALYSTLGDESVEYIMSHAELGIIITEKENVKKLLSIIAKDIKKGSSEGKTETKEGKTESKEPKETSEGSPPGGPSTAPSGRKLEHLRVIIQIDPNEAYGTAAEYVNDADIKTAEELKVRLVGFSEVIKMGQAKTTTFPTPPTEEDLAFIMYTSGTTGMPKGALLRHGNVMAAVASVPSVYKMAEGSEVHCSYLPLAHIFETVVQVAIYACGGGVGFFQGNVKKLTQDFLDLEPTLLCGVPRVFTKIYQKVFQGVSEKNCMVKWYFNKAYQGQCAAVRSGRARDAKYDTKVFIPLRTRIGLGKVRFLITGAAPCPPYLLEFLRVVTGAQVVQGYGMTESAAATSISLPSDPNVGHCGPPLPCNEVKLVDVPEMEYLSTDKPMPRGEVWVHGPNVFAGYYKNEEGTHEALDEKGWLKTGDVGRWNLNGTLSIIDRKKNIFKLAQGEYIAAEKIETVYGKSPIVGQVWVYGNSYKSFCLAVVVPAADVVANYCHTQSWWPSSKEATIPGSEQFIADFHTVCTGSHAEEIKAHVFTVMKEQETALKGFEKVTDIIIESRIDAQMAGFTEANECLTPTFKIRRPFLLARYMPQLKALYSKHGEADKPDEKWPGQK